MPPAPSHESRIHGCLLGGALGDSLGYAVEFDDIATIRARFGPDGLQDFSALDGGSHFSDDTQLTLYTVDGLLEALEWANSGVAADTNACLWLAYLRWLATQGVPVPEAAPFQPPRWIDSHDVLKHRRAPGNACLSGLATGEMGTFYRPVNPDSKGCGTVMRSAPFGLIPYIAAEAVYKLSADAASLTHGHPAARQSAGIFSLIIHALTAGRGLREAAEYALGELDAGHLRKGEEPDPDRCRPAGGRPPAGRRRRACWRPRNWSANSAKGGWRRRHSPSRSTRSWPRHRTRRRLPGTRRPTSARPSPSR